MGGFGVVSHERLGADYLRRAGFSELNHPVVHLLGVERRRVAAVMVGVADDQFAIRRWADQQVNAVFMQVRRVSQDLRLHRRRFR